MTRQALLVANSVTYLDTQKNVPGGLVRRTVSRLETLLRGLPDPYMFQVDTAIDDRPTEVRRKALKAAERAAESDSLLLYYYFGHGALSGEFHLEFVHPGARPRGTERLPLDSVLDLIAGAGAKKTLMILDCCYSGAFPREFSPTLHPNKCLLASTVPTARARVHYQNDEPPIGAFTQAIFNGFSSDRACVSATDNQLTTDSLFRYAKAETGRLTKDLQAPYARGRLAEVLCEYIAVPETLNGLTRDANIKTGYFKVRAIGEVLASGRGFSNAKALYNEILRGANRDAFKTGYKKPNGDTEYRPAQPSVVLRYLRFMRSLGLIEREDLRLSRRGRQCVKRWKTEYNESMLEVLDGYLERHSVSRPRLEEVLRAILSRRGLPSAGEVVDYFALVGHRMPGSELRLALDFLGYIGAIRMAREPVYFPWDWGRPRRSAGDPEE